MALKPNKEPGVVSVTRSTLILQVRLGWKKETQLRGKCRLYIQSVGTLGNRGSFGSFINHTMVLPFQGKRPEPLGAEIDISKEEHRKVNAF